MFTLKVTAALLVLFIACIFLAKKWGKWKAKSDIASDAAEKQRKIIEVANETERELDRRSDESVVIELRKDWTRE